MKNQEKTNENEQITINEIKEKQNFIIIYDSVYKNTNLTLEEIGLINKLVGKAPTFKPTIRKLAEITHLDIRRFNKLTKSLQAKGYLKIKKFGKSSEWTITQQPIENKINDFSEESLLNGLFNYLITIEDINLLHKLKRIDDRLYIKVTEKYAKELIRLAKLNAYKDYE